MPITCPKCRHEFPTPRSKKRREYDRQREKDRPPRKRDRRLYFRDRRRAERLGIDIDELRRRQLSWTLSGGEPRARPVREDERAEELLARQREREAARSAS